jgi:uncharacterized small protein (DUF1192 family)
MNNKEVSIIVAMLLFVAGIFLFGTFGVGGFSPEQETPIETGTGSDINIDEIKKNINNMSVEEIEQTIQKINKEIERLESQLN